MIGRTNADGGGGVSSDETTVVASQVLAGKTYLGSDTDDEAGTGTMPNIQAVDSAKSLSYGSGLVYARMSNGAHITNASSGYPEVSITTQTKSVSPTASSQTVSPDANKVLSGVTVNGVSNLTAGNIKNGVTVGGTAGTYKGLGSAAASQVLSGATFSTASLSNASGTMPNYSGYTSTGNYVSSTFRSATSGYVYASPGATGYYSTGSYLRIPASNLTAANIKKGVSIMGIIGSFEGFVSSPLYLYNNGVWNNLQTTGVTRVWDGPADYAISQAQFAEETTNKIIRVNMSGHAKETQLVKGNGRLNQSVNLDNYNYLKANVSSYESGYIAYVGVSTNSTLQSFSYSASNVPTAAGVIVVNISSLSGLHFIYFGIQSVNTTSQYNKHGYNINEIFLTNS